MKPFSASTFALLSAILNLSNTINTLPQLEPLSWPINKLLPILSPPRPKGGIISEKDRLAFGEAYGIFHNALAELELDACIATVKRMQACLNNPLSKYGEFFEFSDELLGRLLDQMKMRTYFALSIKEAEYYQQPREGWEEIIDKFPAVVGDVEEAKKCFALSRYAATVFHSLQVVEIGVIALGQLIGVTDHLPGWTATTNRLQAIVRKRHEERTPFERQHSMFLEQIYATIEGLKNAWRNKISHAHGKLTLLTADFSPDVAEEILFATRAFMRRLATDAPADPDV